MIILHCIVCDALTLLIAVSGFFSHFVSDSIAFCLLLHFTLSKNDVIFVAPCLFSKGCVFSAFLYLSRSIRHYVGLFFESWLFWWFFFCSDSMSSKEGELLNTVFNNVWMCRVNFVWHVSMKIFLKNVDFLAKKKTETIPKLTRMVSSLVPHVDSLTDEHLMGHNQRATGTKHIKYDTVDDTKAQTNIEYEFYDFSIFFSVYLIIVSMAIPEFFSSFYPAMNSRSLINLSDIIFFFRLLSQSHTIRGLWCDVIKY